MSDEQNLGTEPENKFIYWVAGGLVVVLMVIGLVAYRGAKHDQEADQKAQQLISKLQAAGVQRLPSTHQVARVLGTDGGSVCQDPANALRKATLFSMISNGAAGPGMRPIITDSRLFRGQLAVMSVYCPDELDKVQSFINDLKTSDVVRS
ncbi:MAG: hypothetical protein J2P22_07640 [Nocardioides sp.]|nr:hypothetical protein [Nocardioides sp.]